jgi:hypothetical protein
MLPPYMMSACHTDSVLIADSWVHCFSVTGCSVLQVYMTARSPPPPNSPPPPPRHPVNPPPHPQSPEAVCGQSAHVIRQEGLLHLDPLLQVRVTCRGWGGGRSGVGGWGVWVRRSGLGDGSMDRVAQATRNKAGSGSDVGRKWGGQGSMA